MNYDKKGMTLIESLIALSIVGTASAAFISTQLEDNQVKQQKIVANNLIDIIHAFDQRIVVDGYDATNFNTKNFSNTEAVKQFLREELNSVSSGCASAKWNPLNPTDAKMKALPCELWEKAPYKANLEASISEDSANMVDGFTLDLTFNSDEELIENFKSLNNIRKEAVAGHKREIAGEHYYTFFNRNTGEEDLAVMECLNLKSQCGLRASFNRAGGTEYVMADGKNSMINSHLTFVEAKGQAPLTCIRFRETVDSMGVSNWAKVVDDECGIGLYDSTPSVVEVAVDNSTSRNVLLDKECPIYDLLGNDIVDTGKTSPCGMLNNGSEVIQVVEKIHAENGYFKNFYATNAEITNIDASKITVDVVETDTLKVNVLAELQDLNVLGDATFNTFKTVAGTTATFEGDVEFLGNVTFTGETNFDDLTVETLTVNQNAEINRLESTNVVFANQLSVNGDVSSDKIIIKDNLNVAKTASFRGSVNILEEAKSNVSMSAPIGDFDNINLRLAEIEAKIHTAENQPKVQFYRWFDNGFTGTSNYGTKKATINQYIKPGMLCESEGQTIERWHVRRHALSSVSWTMGTDIPSACAASSSYCKAHRYTFTCRLSK
ncbi:type II secretion system protein [Vibrio harveyi]|uniref:type II secretion system protein n=1 Tax=Vibrio harveyi TaxID=669 RepID=UPI00238052DA|nr:type II secretion system protein [Vibrio harveyi]